MQVVRNLSSKLLKKQFPAQTAPAGSETNNPGVGSISAIAATPQQPAITVRYQRAPQLQNTFDLVVDEYLDGKPNIINGSTGTPIRKRMTTQQRRENTSQRHSICLHPKTQMGQ